MAEVEKQPCAEVIWKIENFTYCWQEKRERLTSSNFFVECLDKTSWHIYMYPKSNSDTDDIGLFLKRAEHDEGNDIVHVKFDVAVLEDGNLPYVHFFSDDHSFSRNGNTGIFRLVSRSDIVKDADKLYPKNVLTVRCKMWHVNAEQPCCPTVINLRTRIPVMPLSFEWNIDLSEAETSDQEKTITIHSLFGYEDFLQAKFSYIKYLENIFLNVFITGSMSDEYSFKCDMQTVPANEYFFLNFRKIDDLPYEMFCRPLLKHNYCVETSQKSLVAHGSHGHPILRLNCEFAVISHEVKKYNFQSNLVIESEKPSVWYPRIQSNCAFDNIRPLKCSVIKTTHENGCCLLKSDVLKMYQQGLKSDFTLQVESQTFSVHSDILSARSEVLSRMFDTEMKEKQERILKIEDLDSNTVKKMLNYVYTDSPGELDIESAVKLYYAGDKYELFGLKQMCSKHMMQNMAICNVYDVLMLSYRHNDEELKSSAIQFIFENEKEMVLSDEFKTFSKNNPQLGVEVMQCLSERRFKN